MTEAQLQEIKVQLVMAHECCCVASALRGVLDQGANRYEQLMAQALTKAVDVLYQGVPKE